MKNIKNISKYIITIILTIFIIIFVIANIARSSILNKNFILKKLDDTAYYVKVYGYIKENFKNYIQQSGFDESILNNVITQEQVKEDTNKIITNLYNNVNEEITAKEIETKLSENIKKATAEIEITEEQQTAIDGFIKDITNEYLNGIAHFDFEKTIYNVLDKAKDIADIAHKISLVGIVILIVLLIVLNLGRIYKMLTFIGISLFSSGLFLIIVNTFINNKINVQTITILNDSFSFTIREIIEATLNMVKSNGTNLFLGGILLIVIPNLIHNIIKYHNKNQIY